LESGIGWILIQLWQLVKGALLAENMAPGEPEKVEAQ
jgi:hypothetical protein